MIDASGHLLGRLASTIAKSLLTGKNYGSILEDLQAWLELHLCLQSLITEFFCISFGTGKGKNQEHWPKARFLSKDSIHYNFSRLGTS